MLSRLLAVSLRWHLESPSEHLRPGVQDRFIFAIWHNRLALSLILYNRYVRDVTAVGRRFAALISASRDGGLLARVAELYGGKPVRGSSSRRGAQALLELKSAAAEGFDLAITPDGPRGPMYSVQPGIIAIAQITGRPIIPVSFWLGWKIQLKSWDQFQVPLPFSRCVVRFAPPIYVPREASTEDRERIRKELETVLKSMEQDGPL
jgi:hypothetical protein